MATAYLAFDIFPAFYKSAPISINLSVVENLGIFHQMYSKEINHSYDYLFFF
jgi:hypothetical protein